MKITAGRLMDAMAKKGFKVFKTGEYNLNLIGIRASELDTNTFNDVICALFKVNGEFVVFTFDATTDPGGYYLNNPINDLGTAIVKPGQYRGLWKLGEHQGKYKALVQKGPVTLYRDNNKDKKVDEGEEQTTSSAGINLHRANGSYKSLQVGKWSAGCQVLADPFDFDLLLSLCEKCAQQWGNSFTYTLLTEDEYLGRKL